MVEFLIRQQTWNFVGVLLAITNVKVTAVQMGRSQLCTKLFSTTLNDILVQTCVRAVCGAVGGVEHKTINSLCS